MDQFKKYLREHRNELDVEIAPPSKIWQQKQPARQFLPAGIVKWMAAASIVLLVSAVLYWSLREDGNHDTSENTIVKNDSNVIQQQPDSLTNDFPIVLKVPDAEDTLKNAIQKRESKRNIAARQSQGSPKTSKKTKLKSSPLQSLETNYATIISYQLKRLERTPIYAESPDYFHVFKKQWYDLEKDEERIREDVQVYGLTDIVVDHFIQLYQNKIGLLKQLQTEIDKMNLRARSHPEFRKQTPTYLKM